jgi:hypothetical protein
MKVKITPLNILLAALLTTLGYLLLFPDENGWRFLGAVSLFILCAVCFIADMIFRFFLKDLKRIWIVEVCFIIFAVVLIVIIRR